MTGPLMRAWLRTLVLQASFNYDRMVAVGWAWAIEPLLRALPGGRGGERYRAAMQRATQFFNTQPYMAGLSIGAVARAEHDALSGDMIGRLRQTLIGPLGSVGDRLFWVGALPASVGCGLIALATVSPIAGVLTFLVLYNVVHLTLRTWSLRSGWRDGRDVSRALTSVGIQRALRLVGPLAALAVGTALPVAGEWLSREFALRTQATVVLVAVLAMVFSLWIAPAFRGLRFGLTAVAVALVTGWLT